MTSYLRPVELEFEGFRSFKQKCKVLFPETGSVLINGRYKDGSTSSGSGKSSIPLAIAFALGFCDLPTTELKNWDSKKIKVRLVLTDGNNTYEIIRKPSLSLVINGEKCKGTSKVAEGKISEILKTSVELTKVLTYRPQREYGKFVNSTDSKNKEFLSSLLGLNEIESAYDTFYQETKACNLQLGNIDAAVTSTEHSISTMKVSEEEFEQAKRNCELAQQRLNSLSDTDTSVKKINADLVQVRQEIEKISKIQREVQTATTQNRNIRSEVEKINNEIKTLQDNICYTCKREWDNSTNLVDSKQDRVRQLIETMKSNIAVVNNAKPLINPEYVKMVTDKQSQLQASLGQLQAPLQDAMTSKQNADSVLRTLTNNRNNIAELEKNVDVKKEERKKTEIELHFSEHISKMMGRAGFLGVIFDEVLQDINVRANDLMKYIPNVNTFTLNISSNEVTKQGKVNKKIDISVIKDGRKVSIKALSGGQKTAIELCTDLAVAETVRLRSGSNLGWIILDEAMDGLDVATKMTILDTIKSKIKGMIVVVDHSTEIKEVFDQVIEVQFDGRESYVI